MIDDIQNLVDAIQEAQKKARHAKHSVIYEPQSTTASMLGYRCVRRIVYARTHPQLASPIGEELASIFEEGNLHQTDVRRELSFLGYEVLEAERSFRDSVLEISGRIDGMLSMPSDFRSRIPLEIKSCVGSPPQDAASMRDHPGLYSRYYAQMQTYLILTSKPFGIFLFKDKISGLWTLVVIALDYDYGESLLRRAEAVRDHVRAGTLPERLDDRSECKACPYVDTICLPADALVDPIKIMEDAELLHALTRREYLESAAKEHSTIDEAIKERFKLTHGDSFVCGDFEIEKKKHGKGIRVLTRRISANGTASRI